MYAQKIIDHIASTHPKLQQSKSISKQIFVTFTSSPQAKMFRFFVVCSIVAAVAGFVQPLTRASSSSSLNMMFNFMKKKEAAPPAKGGKKVVVSKKVVPDFAYGLVGSDVEAPNFDPLQLSAGRSEETVNWYRSAELKHGRVCMLAALGLSVAPVFHFNDPVFDTTLGFGAVTKLVAERPEAIYQIVTAIAAIEVVTLFKNGQGAAGDLGFDPLDLQTKLGFNDDEAKFDEMKLRELKNGRMAMIGTSALLLQEVVTGYGPYEQLLKH